MRETLKVGERGGAAEGLGALRRDERVHRRRSLRARHLLNTEEQNRISDMWEKWGRHIWGKGVLGITKKKKQNSISDIWEKWGRHIWGKGVLGIKNRRTEFDF